MLEGRLHPDATNVRGPSLRGITARSNGLLTGDMADGEAGGFISATSGDGPRGKSVLRSLRTTGYGSIPYVSAG